MKNILFILFLFILNNAGFTQIPCTVILKDCRVIEAYHLGEIVNCKKSSKKNIVFPKTIVICGNQDSSKVEISDFTNIDEIKLGNYKTKSSGSNNYTLEINIRYKDGTDLSLTGACIKCIHDKNNSSSIILPLQIKQSANEYNKVMIDIRNIETLIF